MKNILLKITAWIILVWCCASSMIALGLILAIFILIKDANWIKLILVDAGLVIAAGLIFVVGLGFFKFINSFIKVEEEIEEIEKRKEK